MEAVVMIADIAWVPRGVPKRNPDKVKVDDEQMRQLIAGGVPDTSDAESSDDAVEQRCKGIRGSASQEECSSISQDTEMGREEKHSKEPTESGLRGIAMYATNADDPYVTLHVDSDEEEKEEIEVKPDDNLLAVAKINRDSYTLEIFLYNEENEDWYCHHDYMLDAPPLCIEAIQHDPGNDETGRRKKRDGCQQGHIDAVLSLAWNKITSHVLASGGADKQVILWDLDEAKAAQVLFERDGEVQALMWHPAEQSFILSGTLGGVVDVIDCRDSSGTSSAVWKLNAQIEQAKWNHFNPFCAFVATDDGNLCHIDMRKPGDYLWRGRAHEGSVGGLTLSASIRGLLVTAGHDQALCVWKVLEDGSLLKVHSEVLNIGALHAAEFNPDVSTVCCVGGSSNDLVRLVNVGKMDAVLEAFP